MTDAGSTSLSTSALAKRLKLPIQQLFVTLRDYGWIERHEKGWVLTGKGELHGGDYQNSQRFGRYIVWPESLMEHPLITAIESNQRITPGGMRRYYSHLSIRQINRTLSELGLQRPTTRGLEITALGEKFGGRQDREEEHDLWVVSWPHEIVDNPVVHRELNRLVSDGVETVAEPVDQQADAHETSSNSEAQPTGPMDDLFAHSEDRGPATDDAPARRRTLDGRYVETLLQLRVSDWLYEAQLAYARNRRLPLDEPLWADFYVPKAGLYIECWERDVPTSELTRRLRTREACRELGLEYQEVAAADMERIDDLLSQRLASLGVIC